MDRAVFNFSTVTTTAGPFSNGDNMIAIGWEAIMLDGAAVDSSNVRVSAGAEYNNQEMIWVAQDSFTADMSRALVSTLETNSYHDANFGVSADIRGCLHVNLRRQQ